jgi:hypothetical protein
MENHHGNEAGVEVHDQETEAGIVITSRETTAEGIEEIGTVTIKIETDTGTAIVETEAERGIDMVGMTMTVGPEDKGCGGLRNGIQQCNAHRSGTAQRKTFDGKRSDFLRSECAN